LNSEEFDEDTYEDKLLAWLDKQHAATGRFDQKPITAETPKPPVLPAIEYLIIIGTVVSAVAADPSLAAEIEPDFPDASKPWGMGRNWCEYENACLTNEVAQIKRNGGFDKDVCNSFMGYLSTMLNRKYGIDRSEHSCKNQWYRELRARSGIDERGNFRTPGRDSARYSDHMRVSLTPKSKRILKKQKIEEDDTPTKKSRTPGNGGTLSAKSKTPAPTSTNTTTVLKITFRPKSSSEPQ
jgi:hypothetical protein